MIINTYCKVEESPYRTNRVTFKANDEELKMIEILKSRLKAKTMSDAVRKLIRYEYKKNSID